MRILSWGGALAITAFSLCISIDASAEAQGSALSSPVRPAPAQAATEAEPAQAAPTEAAPAQPEAPAEGEPAQVEPFEQAEAALTQAESSAAPASQCAEGRVATAATAGRCCWPGQSWNAPRARCEGPPRCPTGRVAEGDSCVLAAPTVHVVRRAAPTGAPTFAATGGWGQAPEMKRVSTPIAGMIIAGGLISISAYSMAIITASVHLASGSYCSPYGYGSCRAYEPWVLYIPLIGGYIYPEVDGAVYSSNGEVWGIPTAIGQTLGLALMIIGALARHTSLVPVDEDATWSASMAPELVGGPGEAGLGLRWRF